MLNAGKLRTEGAELELVYRPIKALTLDAQMGYLDAKYLTFKDLSFPGGSRAFQTPAFSPRNTDRLGAAYRLDLHNLGGLTLGG
ncbi:MAG: TonB-dependent receptor, partial [Caulobacteraceae bacterium]|nr:TonB-dependent receptor [Caulobacteraceae bacterium]